MKKVLYGSTALLAVGLMTGAAVAQDKPISLSVSGRFDAFYAAVNQDEGNTNAMGERRSHALFSEREVRFGGQTRLANGLTVGVRVNYEAQDVNDQVDEAWIFFDSAYGRVEIGETDNVAWKMYYGAPSPIPNFGSAVHNIVPWNHNNTWGVAAPYALLNNANDQARISYYTPRFMGVQIGLSYSPEACKEGDRDGCNTAAGVRGANGGIGQNGVIGANGVTRTADNVQDVWEIAANYVNKFGAVNFAVYAGYNHGDNTNPSAAAAPSVGGATTAIASTGSTGLRGQDPKQWGLGAQLGYAGFTVGGAYTRKTDVADLDQTHWNLGVTYATGPWGLGAEYSHVKQERAIGGVRAEDDDGQFLYVGATYLLSPGITLFGGIAFFDMDAGNATPGTNTGRQDNNGAVGLIGTRLLF